MPKYTFLLPAYKAKYFEEALSSIKNQTFKDFLCIVSDDCSPEDLLSIFNKVCGDDSRFVYRKNEKNIGGGNLVVHWNLLVGLCETEYFMMAGDDDIYMPTFLEEVDKLQAKYPEAGLIRARSQFVDENGEITDQDSSFPEYLDLLSFLFYRYNSFFINGIVNYAFKKEIIIKERQFVNFPVAWGSDDAAIFTCSRYGICNTSSILTSMRVSGINLSCQTDRETSQKKITASLQFREWFANFFRKNCHPVTVLEKNQYNSVQVLSDRFAVQGILHYAGSLSIADRIRLFRKLKSNNYSNSMTKRIKLFGLLLLGER